jgi:hypothetical protein
MRIRIHNTAHNVSAYFLPHSSRLKSEWKGTPGLNLFLIYCSLLKISVGGQVLAYFVSSLAEILAIRQLQGGGPI